MSDYYKALLDDPELKSDPTGFLNKHWGVPFLIGNAIARELAAATHTADIDSCMRNAAMEVFDHESHD